MTMDEKMDMLLLKMTHVEEQNEEIKKRLTALEERMTALEERVVALEERVAALEERMSVQEHESKEAKEKIFDIDAKVSGIDARLKELWLMIENELRTAIKLVAEGHLDLSRIFHDAMQPSNTMENLLIRVGMLETDVKALKKKMA